MITDKKQKRKLYGFLFFNTFLLQFKINISKFDKNILTNVFLGSILHMKTEVPLIKK